MMRGAITTSIVVLFVTAVGAGASSFTQTPPAPDKQAVIEHQFAVPPNAAPPALKNPRYVPPHDPPQPRVQLRQVTSKEVQAPVSPAIFTPTSQWLDVVGGIQIAVYGGSHAGAGAIYLWVSNLESGLDDPDTGMFPSRTRGPLTLTGVSGTTVSFEGPNGEGTFDLVTRLFG
jgi:hypothetical protein